jgi:hypothetical protein
MTDMEKAVRWMIAQKKKAEGQAFTIEATTPTGRRTFTVTGWIGRKAFAVAKPTGPRVEFSERDYFFAREDLEAAGLPAPALDWRIWLAGEDQRYKIAIPTAGEPAVVFSDNLRLIYRLHTKHWVDE